MKLVFLSFKAEDKQKVQGLRLLAANPKFDIEFFDESVRTGIRSKNETYVRQKIREKINRTSITVCLCQRRSKSTPLAGVKMHHLMRFSPALAVVPVVHRRDPRCFV